MKRALIFGILGQDGSFMRELLISKGYEVYGVMRKQSGLYLSTRLFEIDITNAVDLLKLIREVMPHEIYNFAAVSNVIDPWKNPAEMFTINAAVPQSIMAIIKEINPSIKFFQASSALIFGRDTSGLQNERTPPAPLYPYGIAKFYAQNMVKEYRETFGMFACSGIFFPHESERRNEVFLSRKVSKAIARIKNGSNEKITLGNLYAHRNYGYAPDYMEAAWLMMQQDKADDYVIGSKNNYKVIDLVHSLFEAADIQYRDHVLIDDSAIRKGDEHILKPDYEKIRCIGWKPTHDIYQIAEKMVEHDIKALSQNNSYNLIHNKK